MIVVAPIVLPIKNALIDSRGLSHRDLEIVRINPEWPVYIFWNIKPAKYFLNIFGLAICAFILPYIAFARTKARGYNKKKENSDKSRYFRSGI